MPAAHVVAVPVQVHETRIKFMPSHRDESVQKIQKFWGPVEIFVQLEAGVVVVAGAVPRHQTGLVLPFTANFDLKKMLQNSNSFYLWNTDLIKEFSKSVMRL